MMRLFVNVPVQGKTVGIVFQHESLPFKAVKLLICSYNFARKICGLNQEWIYIPVIYSKTKGGVVGVKNYWR